jgi:hypothetical protein
VFSAKGAAHFKPRVTPEEKDFPQNKALKVRVKLPSLSIPDIAFVSAQKRKPGESRFQR